LRIDSATAEIARSLAGAGVDSLVLKGPAIASWLYSEAEPRYYLDSDLLVRPAHLAQAESVFKRLGFAKRFDDSRMPDWWREHASEWRRGADGVLVDVHRTLPGVGIGDEQAWGLLSAQTCSITVAGESVPTLALPARTLHIALHAGHHGVAWAKPLADLERAIHSVEEVIWRDAAVLADRLEATQSFAVGLGLTPAGEALAGRLGLLPVRSVVAVLHASSPPPVALGIDQLARARNTRERMAIVSRKLLPPVDFIRHWQPKGTDTRRGLALAYARRPLWIMRNLPRAAKAWWRARHQVRRGGD
jgi:hypothetical protein